MGIQASALPPSLVAELHEMQRRLSALERKPKLGSVNQPMPYGSFQTPSLEGVTGAEFTHTLGVVNSTGLNQPVVLFLVPFSIPYVSGAPLDVSVTLWITDMVTGGTTSEITIDKNSTPNEFSRTITWSWVHPQPIGFDDPNEWKGFALNYRVNKRVSSGGVSLTVGMGNPLLVTGIPLGTYVEESPGGNPRVGGSLTPTNGGPATWV